VDHLQKVTVNTGVKRKNYCFIGFAKTSNSTIAFQLSINAVI